MTFTRFLWLLTGLFLLGAVAECGLSCRVASKPRGPAPRLSQADWDRLDAISVRLLAGRATETAVITVFVHHQGPRRLARRPVIVARRLP